MTQRRREGHSGSKQKRTRQGPVNESDGSSSQAGMRRTHVPADGHVGCMVWRTGKGRPQTTVGVHSALCGGGIGARASPMQAARCASSAGCSGGSWICRG